MNTTTAQIIRGAEVIHIYNTLSLHNAVWCLLIIFLFPFQRRVLGGRRRYKRKETKFTTKYFNNVDNIISPLVGVKRIFPRIIPLSHRLPISMSLLQESFSRQIARTRRIQLSFFLSSLVCMVLHYTSCALGYFFSRSRRDRVRGYTPESETLSCTTICVNGASAYLWKCYKMITLNVAKPSTPYERLSQ